MIEIRRVRNDERMGVDYLIFVADADMALVHPAALLQEESAASVILNLGTIAIAVSKEQEKVTHEHAL